jgi:DNA polymerase (family 10)
MVTNAEVAALLEEFADLLEATGVDYKPRAYRRAAENVREHPESVASLAAEGEDAVAEVDRVGDAIAAKIVEYVETGRIGELEELRAELPVEMAALTAVEGVGPKTVGALYEALGITSLDELESAAEAGEIRAVSGFGAKTEENILSAIPFARQSRERTRLGDARPLADAALDYLRDHDAVERVSVAGSLRRWKATVGDVDVLVASADGPAVVDAFTDWPDAGSVIEAGETKASVRAGGGAGSGPEGGDARGVRVDLRVARPGEFGAALQYFTGSWDHNVHLRNVAIERGLKMNEYGVFDVSDLDAEVDAEEPDTETGERAGRRVGGETEAEMYAAVDLPLVPPELREDAGEIAAARDGELPDLVAEGAIRGDLHTHTDWSDGDATIAEMVAGAVDRGYDYHVVSDHATGPGMVGGVGLTEADLADQAAAVADVADDAPIPVLHGVEANIDADGGLATDDDALAELDLVVASPHSALGQDRETATERLVRAVEHPHVDVLGHPTGRLINERPGLGLDVARIAEAAAEHGTALEVNANPARLDLDGGAVRIAVEAGATIAVNTDAHRPAEFDLVRYGVHTARRGWATGADVLNARGYDGLVEFLEAD